MSLSQEMTNLGNECIRSFNDRMNFLGRNIADVQQFHFQTRNFLSHLKNNRKMMSRKLHHDLRDFTQHLTDTVDHLRENCRRHQKNLHNEFKQGHFAFQRMAKTMQAKRHNFFNTLREKSRQEFNHPPRKKGSRRKKRTRH